MGTPGKTPSSRSSKLGWVAAVIATLSPSHPSPAVNHNTDKEDSLTDDFPLAPGSKPPQQQRSNRDSPGRQFGEASCQKVAFARPAWSTHENHDEPTEHLTSPRQSRLAAAYVEVPSKRRPSHWPVAPARKLDARVAQRTNAHCEELERPLSHRRRLARIDTHLLRRHVLHRVAISCCSVGD